MAVRSRWVVAALAVSFAVPALGQTAAERRQRLLQTVGGGDAAQAREAARELLRDSGFALSLWDGVIDKPEQAARVQEAQLWQVVLAAVDRADPWVAPWADLQKHDDAVVRRHGLLATWRIAMAADALARQAASVDEANGALVAPEAAAAALAPTAARVHARLAEAIRRDPPAHLQRAAALQQALTRLNPDKLKLNDAAAEHIVLFVNYVHGVSVNVHWDAAWIRDIHEQLTFEQEGHRAADLLRQTCFTPRAAGAGAYVLEDATIVMTSLKRKARGLYTHIPFLRRDDPPRPRIDPFRVGLCEVLFDGAPFSQVVEFFHQVTGQAIVVDWEQLDAAGIDPEAGVQHRRPKGTLGPALSAVLLWAGKGDLAWTSDGEVIFISTRKQVEAHLRSPQRPVEAFLLIAAGQLRKNPPTRLGPEKLARAIVNAGATAVLRKARDGGLDVEMRLSLEPGKGSLLHHAVWVGEPDCARLLLTPANRSAKLEAGNDPDLRPLNGLTPLQLAQVRVKELTASTEKAAAADRPHQQRRLERARQVLQVLQDSPPAGNAD